MISSEEGISKYEHNIRPRRPSSWPLPATSLRRGIPHVERHEEQQLRTLWETDPFVTARAIVDHVIVENATPPLTIVAEASASQTGAMPPSGYEELFSRLYEREQTIGTADDFVLQNGSSTSQNNRPHIAPKPSVQHFLLQVAYRGDAFCGWQRQLQNSLPSVQKSLEDCCASMLMPQQSQTNTSDLQNSATAAVNFDGFCPDAHLPVCGRTDAGVHSIGQICRLRTKSKHSGRKFSAGDIKHYADRTLDGTSLRVTRVEPVTRAFHPSFGATCRAYAYFIDLRDDFPHFEPSKRKELLRTLNSHLQELEGKALDYIGISYGKLKTKDSICTLHHARAKLVTLNVGSEDDENALAICVELVGDRFLRRMIRRLMEATMLVTLRTLSEYHTMRSKRNASSPPHLSLSLLKWIQLSNRRLLQTTAPAIGLMFVGAKFECV